MEHALHGDVDAVQEGALLAVSGQFRSIVYAKALDFGGWVKGWVVQKDGLTDLNDRWHWKQDSEIASKYFDSGWGSQWCGLRSMTSRSKYGFSLTASLMDNEGNKFSDDHASRYIGVASARMLAGFRKITPSMMMIQRLGGSPPLETSPMATAFA